ncbi:hypothetical protein OPV22_020824 [Ensete ventricosum]|uniref:Legume lectin domain-containing protein n=1 Tax=Ensete ventricosum TaxID=4639 RepID=A0AAV8QP71_ENSVE|nr:hypothetical protein OPV22_020824 [Ensete ventricosum]
MAWVEFVFPSFAHTSYTDESIPKFAVGFRSSTRAWIVSGHSAVAEVFVFLEASHSVFLFPTTKPPSAPHSSPIETTKSTEPEQK